MHALTQRAVASAQGWMMQAVRMENGVTIFSHRNCRKSQNTDAPQSQAASGTTSVLLKMTASRYASPTTKNPLNVV